MDQIQKVPASLNAPPVLVKNNMRPLGQISFQVLGDDDKRVITVNVPRDYNVIDLTHQAPFHNLVNSSSLKRLIDETKLILLNKAEIDEWIKDKCPESSGENGTCPVPELKDQKPITFDETFSDATELKGKAEPQATISITVGSDVYFGIAGADGSFSIPAKDLAVGTYTARAIKTGFKEKTGSLEVKVLEAGTALVVNPFEIKGTVTGTAGANASITVSSLIGSVEATAGPDGAFSVSTATLYLSDTDYEITIVAKEDGKEKQEFKTHGTKLAVPTVTSINVLTYGDTSAVVKTEPYARVKLGAETATADSQGNLVFSVDVKADLEFEFGFDSTSIYEAGTQTLAPTERQVFIVSSDAQKDATEHKVRVLGQVAFLPKAQVVATIGSEVKTGTANDQGEVTLTDLDLSTVTSFTVELASTEYKADTITVQVVTATEDLLDQQAIVVNPVFEDSLEITGVAEKGAIVEIIIGSETFYTKSGENFQFRLALPKAQAPGTYTINSYKSGYKDATKQFDINANQDSAPLVINEYQAHAVMSGTSQAGATITVTNSVGSVTTTSDLTSGEWSVATATLFPRDKNEELTVTAVRKKYKTVEQKITGQRIPAPAINLANTLYYGDRAVAISTAAHTRVTYNTTEVEVGDNGNAVFVFTDPLAASINLTTGASEDSIYIKTDTTITPTKWETYLIASQTKQADTTMSVRVLSLTTGLPLPSAELSFNGDVHTADADSSGIITFTGLDLTSHTEAVVKLVSDVYVAAPITVKILTEEEAGDKKDQRPLTAEQVYADDTTLKGTGEPLAIMQIDIQGRAYYSRIATDGNWTISLRGDHSDPMTYNINAYKQGYHDATGQLKVNALKTLANLEVGDFDIGGNVTGTGEPGAKLTMNVVGYPDSNAVSLTIGQDGSFTQDTSVLYTKDLNGLLTVEQTAKNSTTQRIAKEATNKVDLKAITLDRPVTYGDQYFIIQAVHQARITYQGQTKICDQDGQVLFRPMFLNEEIKAAIGLAEDSIYQPYTATLVPNKIRLYFSTQTIMSSQTEITFKLLNLTAPTKVYKYKLRTDSDAAIEVESSSKTEIKFTGLDLTATANVYLSIVDPIFDETEQVFVVTKGTITPPEQDQSEIVLDKAE